MIRLYYPKFIEESEYRIHFEFELLLTLFPFTFTFSVTTVCCLCFYVKMHEMKVKIVQNKTKPANEPTAAVL